MLAKWMSNGISIQLDPRRTLYYLIVFVGIIGSYAIPVDIFENNLDLFNLTILMPNVTTIKDDQYVYLQYKLPDEELMIVGITPINFAHVAHHILTFTCSIPKSNQHIWNVGPECSANGQQAIIHDWGRGAPPINLPDDVGFSVGANTTYKYIVINLHYLSPVTNDQSGVQLLMTRKRRAHEMRVMLGGSNIIYINPKSNGVSVQFSCLYDSIPISIFAAHVHTHQFGRVNSLYRFRNGSITEVYKGDPQWPQAFYSLAMPIDVQAGDVLIGQCVYDNDGDRRITMGTTHNDEMCNVYAMYSFDLDLYRSTVKDVATTPILNCWNNAFPNLTGLIPLESKIPPVKSIEAQHSRQHEQSKDNSQLPISSKMPESNNILVTVSNIAASKDNTTTMHPFVVSQFNTLTSQRNTKPENTPQKNRSSLSSWILILISVSILIPLIIICAIKLRKICFKKCFGRSVRNFNIHKKDTGSMIGNWFNHRGILAASEPHLDDEHVPLNQNDCDQSIEEVSDSITISETSSKENESK